MSLLTFDWTQVAYIGSPLATPWWAEANVAVGFVVFFWIITPILYFTNVWYSQFMPILSRATYDNKGGSFDVSRVLTNNRFDVEKYENYSPLFLPVAFAISYALSFASVTGKFVLILQFPSDSDQLNTANSDHRSCLPLLPQTNPPSGQTLLRRATRYPRQAHVPVPSSPRLVVLVHICVDVSFWDHRHRIVLDRDARLGICPCIGGRIRLYHSHRHYSGCHESADGVERDYGAHHRIFTAWPTSGNDVVQNLGIYRSYRRLSFQFTR